jgi:hypothetical protein
MSRTILNFWLDVLLLLSFAFGLWAAVVVRVVFPPGTAATGWRLWGFTFDQWWDFQFTLLCVFALTVVVHVMLHWTWVCGIVSSRLFRDRDGAKRQWTDGERTLLGVALLVALMIVMGVPLAAAMFSVQSP